jgi:hypothetical protein
LDKGDIMENQEYNAFKTKVVTIMSILAVLVFLLYIGAFLFLTSMPMEPNDIEVVKIDERNLPDSWTVHLKLNTEGKGIEVIMNIRDGKIEGGVAGESLADITY